ncbi:MAG: N-acetyltransferase [Cereibacter sphaeroides]|uniref:N-acetyltransferase n=1 Tax=Cereibacter sphaeroides TaxID=1063 RepID=A0A2W5S9B4_CERSP|nr:MAG: N-acetyltransferase [Cereibacter sphaeroides]
MTLRAATEADIPAMFSLLRQYESTSLFPLARLSEAGLGGDGPHALCAWVAEEDAAISGVVGLSAAGMLLPQWPGAAWSELRPALAGHKVSGAVGPAEQVRPMLAALGLASSPARHNGDEAGFVLELADLVEPTDESILIRPDHGHRPLMTEWRAAYLTEIFATPPAEAARQAEPDVDRWLAADSHRILQAEGQPVAMSGFNARLPDVVQIGGVYTPPALRGRGHARAVVARHLSEVRSKGVRRAALFAVSPAAVRAYRAIGFREKGRMSLVLFESLQRIRA